mgnify:CR=1 FL=1
MAKSMINTADLRSLVESDSAVEAVAVKAPEGIDGYLLQLFSGSDEMVLSTYLSDKPRLFKRADALLKEAGNMELSSVRFEI